MSHRAASAFAIRLLVCANEISPACSASGSVPRAGGGAGAADEPLAERMRPATLEEFIGSSTSSVLGVGCAM